MNKLVRTSDILNRLQIERIDRSNGFFYLYSTDSGIILKEEIYCLNTIPGWVGNATDVQSHIDLRWDQSAACITECTETLLLHTVALRRSAE